MYNTIFWFWLVVFSVGMAVGYVIGKHWPEPRWKREVRAWDPSHVPPRPLPSAPPPQTSTPPQRPTHET
jgi:hypothetical protein